MEPRLFSHGYYVGPVFRRSHHDPSMEPRLFSHGYLPTNGVLVPVSPPLQWSHGFSAMDTCPRTVYWCRFHHPFNGATAFQPWIPRCPIPPRLGRPTFNGATAFQPWIPDGNDIKQGNAGVLQWSHGFSAMDTSSMPTVTLKFYRLQWSHGFSAMDTLISGLPTGGFTPLQWSHGFSAMDTLISGLPTGGFTPLQWSHGFSAMDTCSLSAI